MSCLSMGHALPVLCLTRGRPTAGYARPHRRGKKGFPELGYRWEVQRRSSGKADMLNAILMGSIWTKPVVMDGTPHMID